MIINFPHVWLAFSIASLVNLYGVWVFWYMATQFMKGSDARATALVGSYACMTNAFLLGLVAILTYPIQ